MFRKLKSNGVSLIDPATIILSIALVVALFFLGS